MEGHKDEELGFGMKHARSQCQPIEEGVSMPDLTASGLRQLGFQAQTLDFWTAGTAPHPSVGPGLGSIEESLAPPKSVKVHYQHKSGGDRVVEVKVPATLDVLTLRLMVLLGQVS